MALPPKGDPRRPLHLAIRSARMLAFICLLAGSCATFPIFFGNRGARMRAPFVAVSVLLFYLGPGGAYLVFCVYMKQRKFWAVLCTLILASIQLLLVLIASITLLIISSAQSGSPGLILMALLGLIILAMIQLIYHLALSFDAIKHVPPEEQRGFQPLMPAPIPPPPPDDSHTPP